MYDRSYTFKTANEVLKNEIIPNITDGIAKEQAIALIAVLKNLETNTVENIKPKEQIIILMKQSLTVYIQKLQSASNHFPTAELVRGIEEGMQMAEDSEDATEKWKVLNEVQCQLLRFLYKEKLNNPEIDHLYITPLRKKIREQLNLEIALVR